MKKSNLGAVVISAGYSSRMKELKPLLKFGEYTAIETVINTFRTSGIDNIIVVVGYRDNEIIEVLKNSGVKCVKNEDYSKGMYSSIVSGMEALDDKISGFFMLPVDIPLVKSQTIKILKSKYLQCDKGIIYPSFNGEIGHPPIIDCKYKPIIVSSDRSGGLKKVLEKYNEDSAKVPVFDKSILMDMDTQEDYKNLTEYFNFSAPTVEECYCILDLYGVPYNIIRHCVEVSKVSLKILYKLNENGYNFNKNVIQASALLHDLARSKKNHAEAGAKILEELGYKHVGKVISTHMDIEVDENGLITENEILYLADKLVKEDKYVELYHRFSEYSLKFDSNIEALKKMQKRFKEAEKIEKKIRNVVGEILPDIIERFN
ncbi:NTP transferase domain-containing protein [Clostridium sp. P21]|uniref:NTP transferase domain-containing protein n=1 Tax=Clostridium muellerianum TaxID=2716538 RepID=A0A7Y0ED48_9CLOT|nr:NTP transferase domain-containing protein [Clostridium muellerianum]NMM61237.1 NTP transferase domain-containing protein [Clostridium muellerianum]